MWFWDLSGKDSNASSESREDDDETKKINIESGIGPGPHQSVPIFGNLIDELAISCSNGCLNSDNKLVRSYNEFYPIDRNCRRFV
jgi:hypothetical protein